jgi:hypothetical protein
MAFWKKRLFWPHTTQTGTNHGVKVAFLAAPQHHPPVLSTSPPSGNDSAWYIDELESWKFGVVGLIVTMAAMAGWSVSSTFLLVNVHERCRR